MTTLFGCSLASVASGRCRACSVPVDALADEPLAVSVRITTVRADRSHRAASRRPDRRARRTPVVTCARKLFVPETARWPRVEAAVPGRARQAAEQRRRGGGGGWCGEQRRRRRSTPRTTHDAAHAGDPLRIAELPLQLRGAFRPCRLARSSAQRVDGDHAAPLERGRRVPLVPAERPAAVVLAAHARARRGCARCPCHRTGGGRGSPAAERGRAESGRRRPVRPRRIGRGRRASASSAASARAASGWAFRNVTAKRIT